MKGFMLLDLIISIAISGILGLTVYNIIAQLERSASYVSVASNTGIALAILNERLEKDFNGLFWPQLEQERSKPDTKVSLAKILFSQNQSDNQLKELSFITCNPLQVYGESASRVMRVTYSLEPDLDWPGSFRLIRQQSLELDYKLSRATPSFMIMNGIRCLKCVYFYPETKKSENTQSITELSLDYIPRSELAKKRDSTSDQNNNLLPKYIKLELSLWRDRSQRKSEDFELWYQFYAKSLSAPAEPVKNNQEHKSK